MLLYKYIYTWLYMHATPLENRTRFLKKKQLTKLNSSEDS